MESKKIKVVGIAGGSKDVEVWHFTENDPLLQPFCERLVRTSGHNVILITGEVVGTYQPKEYPIEFIPFENRFKDLSKSASLPSTFSGQ